MLFLAILFCLFHVFTRKIDTRICECTRTHRKHANKSALMFTHQIDIMVGTGWKIRSQELHLSVHVIGDKDAGVLFGSSSAFPDALTGSWSRSQVIGNRSSTVI